jgi:hypothetical protein
MEQKRQLPRLKKKNRTIGDVGADSLTAALFHQELTAGDQEVQEQKQPAPEAQEQERQEQRGK